ncbi:MAG: hypothetical protein QOD99_1097 [Chthoniobacter sp.]|jgi:pimeloyl-ACP methyl ester carboxylesterase|nr:hypothetical protein [Chthoniobacter sp.]
MRTLIVLHGWSDNATSFEPLAGWLRGQGFDVVGIWLGDYLSMNDEVSLYDLGNAFRRALDFHKIPQARHSFDLITHSTGGLVAREYLRQSCVDENGEPDAVRAPIAHLCMLAPANFGSPLANLGKSVIGRFFKGWDWNHFAESGKQVLDALELAAPYSFWLGVDDLFRAGYRIFAPENTFTTVMVGTISYPGIKSVMHENGSDGTVRVSTANLNATYLSVDFADANASPKPVAKPRVNPDIAFAVFHRNHGSITKAVPDKDSPELAQVESWQKTLLDALRLEPGDYSTHAARCSAITDQTFVEGRQGPNPDWYHRYQHVVFRVHDQFGNSIPDYVIEFYQQDRDDDDRVMEFIHKEIVEKVHTNAIDHGYRSFLIDTDDLIEFIDKHDAEVCMSITAAHVSRRIRYRNPEHGFRVFTKTNRGMLHPNEPILVNITLYRDPDVENPDPALNVFRLLPA